MNENETDYESIVISGSHRNKYNILYYNKHIF